MQHNLINLFFFSTKFEWIVVMKKNGSLTWRLITSTVWYVRWSLVIPKIVATVGVYFVHHALTTGWRRRMSAPHDATRTTPRLIRCREHSRRSTKSCRSSVRHVRRCVIFMGSITMRKSVNSPSVSTMISVGMDSTRVMIVNSLKPR